MIEPRSLDPLTARFCRGLSSMPMQAESLEVLEKADVPPAQARAIVRAIELEIAGAKDTLATKHDVLALRHDFDALRHDVEMFRSDVRRETSELGTTHRAEMTTLAATLRTEMAAQGGALRAEIHASASGVIRQLYVAVLGQMAVLLGFVYFFSTHLR